MVLSLVLIRPRPCEKNVFFIRFYFCVLTDFKSIIFILIVFTYVFVAYNAGGIYARFYCIFIFVLKSDRYLIYEMLRFNDFIIVYELF
jgi:hypothetical protein